MITKIRQRRKLSEKAWNCSSFHFEKHFEKLSSSWGFG
jgi:hypothetical protein